MQVLVQSDPQVPQLPPQPSSPQARPAQFGVQEQVPATQVPVEQVPQLPPHPSSPHSRVSHDGAHVESGRRSRSVEASAGADASGRRPPSKRRRSPPAPRAQPANTTKERTIPHTIRIASSYIVARDRDRLVGRSGRREVARRPARSSSRRYELGVGGSGVAAWAGRLGGGGSGVAAWVWRLDALPRAMPTASRARCGTAAMVA